MPLLALDTSAAISVAVLLGDGRVVERNLLEFRLHAEQLSVVIAAALAGAGVTPTDLTGIAVGTGPGPFTGLRIGLAAARTLAFVLDVPLYGVCSLDALAAQAIQQLELAPDTELIVATDARRREVYWAQYLVVPSWAETLPTHSAPDKAPKPLANPHTSIWPAYSAAPLSLVGPRVSKPDSVEQELAAILPNTIVGQGTLLYPDALPATQGAPALPSAAALGQIALSRAQLGIEQPTDPLYLRRPDIHGVPVG